MSVNRNHFSFSRILATLLFWWMGRVALEIGRQLNSLGVFFSLGTFWWPAVLIISILSLTGILLVWMPWFQVFIRKFSRIHRDHWPKNGLVSWGLFILLAVGFSVWVMVRGYIVLNGYNARVFMFMLVSIVGMLLLRPLAPDRDWKIALAISALVLAAIFRGMIYITDISASPFSLSWSEGSRYYYGSLFFSKSLYGLNLPLSPWHPSRYMLLSLPFFIPGLPIWAHRFWQACLWVGLAGWAGYLLAKRLKINGLFLFIGFTTWAFLYIHLGPVYYHLLVCVILIYWGVDFDKPTKTMAILLASSVWAGLSRINWVPVPVFLVVTLYFLERPWDRTHQGWRYFKQPVIWSFGLIVALLSSFGYIQLSGNDAGKFGSSFTSDLLWYRLWPNPTFQTGILLGTVLVSLPLWLILYVGLRNRISNWDRIKWLAYTAMMVALFMGGLVVSVKIGGGSNLHNMDAYFIYLMTIASYVYWGRDVSDHPAVENTRRRKIPQWLSAVGIIIPLLFTLRDGGLTSFPDPNKDKTDLSYLQYLVSEASAEGGEVLFITERQLQVFDLVPEVPFVADYEKVELMEMAMSGNEAYLDRFYHDIFNQRFALIISDPIRLDMKDETEAFPEEHNVWVEKVVFPLVETYRHYTLVGRRSIMIMVPKD
jgi:hypothetical protein